MSVRPKPYSKSIVNWALHGGRTGSPWKQSKKELHEEEEGSSDSVAAKQAPWGKKRQLICLAAAVAAAAILLTGTEGFSVYDLDRLV